MADVIPVKKVAGGLGELEPGDRVPKSFLQPHDASEIAGLDDEVRAVTLAGLDTGTAADVTADDNLLSAFGKLQARVTAMLASIASKLTSPMTTLGDLIVGGPSGAAQRLGIGAALQVLRVNAAGNGLEWATPSSVSATYTSPEQTITAGGSLTLAHGLGALPALYDLLVVCKTAELGWAVGDYVKVGGTDFSTSSTTQAGATVGVNATSAKVQVAPQGIYIHAFGTGTVSTITPANWRIVVRARL